MLTLRSCSPSQADALGSAWRQHGYDVDALRAQAAPSSILAAASAFEAFRLVSAALRIGADERLLAPPGGGALRAAAAAAGDPLRRLVEARTLAPDLVPQPLGAPPSAWAPQPWGPPAPAPDDSGGTRRVRPRYGDGDGSANTLRVPDQVLVEARTNRWAHYNDAIDAVMQHPGCACCGAGGHSWSSCPRRSPPSPPATGVAGAA